MLVCSWVCNWLYLIKRFKLLKSKKTKQNNYRYVLATGSTVFYAMLYGGLSTADANKDVIDVPDVEPSAFLTMLRYLYCDEINLSPDNVLATLYCAKKYIVPHLVR